MLRALTEFGSSEWRAIVLSALVLLFVWKRWWPSLVTLLVAVPCGMLLNGFTRIALGAHFLTDVLAAIFFGIIWLMLCAVLGSPFNGGPSLQRFPLVIARI